MVYYWSDLTIIPFQPSQTQIGQVVQRILDLASGIVSFLVPTLSPRTCVSKRQFLSHVQKWSAMQLPTPHVNRFGLDLYSRNSVFIFLRLQHYVVITLAPHTFMPTPCFTHKPNILLQIIIQFMTQSLLFLSMLGFFHQKIIQQIHLPNCYFQEQPQLQ